MKKDKHEMTSEESLQIIARMINTAQGNLQQNSFYFLFWGWIVVIASTAHFYIDNFTNFKAAYMVWLISIPGWIISMLYGYRQSKKATVKTYSDHLLMWTWIGFLFSILIVIFAGRQINFQITPIIMIFTGLCTFISGLIIRFRPLILGGSTFWILAPIALYLPGSYSPLIMAIAIIFGYLIPGYLLKKTEIS